ALVGGHQPAPTAAPAPTTSSYSSAASRLSASRRGPVNALPARTTETPSPAHRVVIAPGQPPDCQSTGRPWAEAAVKTPSPLPTPASAVSAAPAPRSSGPQTSASPAGA